MSLVQDLHQIVAEHTFSGSISVQRNGESLASIHAGDANRAYARPIVDDTRFGTASMTKGLTALTVASLIESGDLALDTTLHSVIEDDLATIDQTVTIDHLLTHTSGIGDYLDEDDIGDIDDETPGVPPQTLATPEDYLPLLRGHAQRTPPGEQFAYNNGGYVVLSIAVERATGQSFYDLVRARVLEPAGMVDTEFLRSDDLPARAALGYLANGRTNVFSLPVRGAGDGGAYTTVADIERLWSALFAGRVLPMPVVESLVERHTVDAASGRAYGRGFWLWQDRTAIELEGMDAGVSLRTVYDRASALSYTVISNTSTGAWPVAGYLDEQLAILASAG